MAQEQQSSGLHIFVSLKQLSSTCHVSFLAAPDAVHKHKFSLTHFIHFSYLSDGLTFTNKPYDSQPTDVPRQSGVSTQIPSLTFRVKTGASTPPASFRTGGTTSFRGPPSGPNPMSCQLRIQGNCPDASLCRAYAFAALNGMGIFCLFYLKTF